MINSVSFMPGFNAWYIVAPLMAVAMGYLGWLKYALDYKTLKICRVFSEAMMKGVAVFLGVCFELMLKVESEKGLVQMCINRFGDEAYIAMPFYAMGMMVVAVAYMFLLYYVQVITGNLKAERLRKERRRLRLEQEVRENRREENIIDFPGSMAVSK